MADVNLPAGAFAKPLPGSGRLERKLRKRGLAVAVTKEEKRQQDIETELWRAQRFAAYTRDHGRCRAFGTPLIFEGEALATRSHCHHVTFRSQQGGNESSNLATLSNDAHTAIHDLGTLTCEGNADETLIFTQKNLETGAIVRRWESPVPR